MLLGVGIGENSKQKNYYFEIKTSFTNMKALVSCPTHTILPSYGSCLIFLLYRRYFTVQNNQLMYQKRLKVPMYVYM